MENNKPACAEVEEQIEAFLDGDLEAAETRAVEEHLQGCPSCAEEAAWARRVRAELRALPRLECPSSAVEGVLQHARREGRGSTVIPLARHHGEGLHQPPPPQTSWVPRFAAAAAVLLAVMTGILLLSPNTGTQEEFTAAELAQAEEEARLALAYVADLQRRAGAKIQEDVLLKRVVQPPQQALSRIIQLPESQEKPL